MLAFRHERQIALPEGWRSRLDAGVSSDSTMSNREWCLQSSGASDDSTISARVPYNLASNGTCVS